MRRSSAKRAVWPPTARQAECTVTSLARAFRGGLVGLGPAQKRLPLLRQVLLWSLFELLPANSANVSELTQLKSGHGKPSWKTVGQTQKRMQIP